MRWNETLFVSAVIALCGCNSQPSVAPPAQGSSVGASSQAVVTPGRVWYFKSGGPSDPAPAGTTPAIANWKPLAVIVDSLTFSSDGTPSWKVPAEWTQKTVVENQSYELVHPSGSRIEISSALLPDISRDGVIKAQLNVWRKEVGLAPFVDDQWLDAFESGVHRSTMSGRTHYSFQFGKVPAEGTKQTVLGIVIPHPDPAAMR